MPQFGRFETVEELASSGPVTVYTARPAGEAGDPAFVVKTFRTVDDLADPEILAARAAAFLRSSDALLALSKAAPTIFANVHDKGSTENSVYFISDLAPLTAQWLVDNKKDLSPQNLGRIIGAVIAGIESIRSGSVCAAHANLRPTNVLLSSREVEEARITLTDPLDPRQLNENSPEDDMKALGALMFELVAHRTAPSGTAIRKGPEWERLRGPGELLRQLCEQLLNPTTGQELTPATAKAKLDAALAIRDSSPGKTIGIAAAALVVLAGGGFFAYKKFNPVAQQQQQAPPVEVVDDVRNDAFRKPLADALNGAKAQLTEQLSDRFEALEATGNAAKEEFLAQYRDLQKEYDDFLAKPGDSLEQRKELKAAAPALEEKIKAIGPAILARLDRLEAVKAVGDFEAAAAKLASARINRLRQISSTTTDEKGKEAAKAILAAYDEAVASAAKIKESAAAAPAAGESSPKFTESVAALVKAIEPLEKQCKDWANTYDAAGAQLEMAVETDAKAFDARTSDTSEPLARVKRRFFEYVRGQYLGSTSASLEGYKKLATGMDAWIASVSGLRTAIEKAPQGAVLLLPAAEAEALSLKMAEIEVEALATANNRSKAIGELLERADPGQDPQVAAAKDRIDAFSKNLYGALTRGGTIRDLIANGALFKEDLGGTTLEAMRNALRDDASLKQIDALANPAGDVTDKQREAAGAFAATLASLRAQLTAADAVETVGAATSTDALKSLMGQKDNLSRTLSAWQKLLATGFPATPEQYEDLVLLHKSLPDQVDKAPKKERAQQIKDRITAAGRAAWFDLVNKKLTSEPATVTRALSAANIASLNMDAQEIFNTLQPHAQINWLRLEMVKELDGAKDKVKGMDRNAMALELKQLLDRNVAKMEGLAGFASVKDSPEYAAMLAKLKRPREGKAGADLTRAGPGLKGWSMQTRDEDGNVVAYSASTKDATQLEFVKLPASNDEWSYYLCTTELSIGAFLDVLEMVQQRPAAGKKSPVLDLMLDDYTSSGDPRPGPRTWGYLKDRVIIPTRTNARTESQGWYSDNIPGIANIKPFYAQGITVAPSGKTLPMTYLRIEAAAYVTAMAGCRFPTSAEMASLLSQGEPSDSNRRDATWASQYTYIAQQNEALNIQAANRPKLLPDAGMFLTAADYGNRPEDGNAAVSRNDGQLWFSEVNKGGGISVQGTTVYHLFGNAAEFVCDAPDIIPPISTAAAADAAIKASPTSFLVMGASALSPARYEPAAKLSASWTSANSKDGFSDVGIRLAFTAEGGTAAAGGAYAKAIRDLSELKFLSPPGGGR